MRPAGQRIVARILSYRLGQLHKYWGDEPMAGGNGYVRQILQKIEKHESVAGADLRNLYLSGMDLSNLDLRGANLKGCRLSNGKLADQHKLQEGKSGRHRLSWRDRGRSRFF
jgi:hypothetical protein